MKSWKTPTHEQVARAVALLGHAEQYRYFFDRLENPLWLGPLAEKGFFRNPRGAERDEANGTIRFPIWPESRYLARMASYPGAQQQVLEIALHIPPTDNVRVDEDLADIALTLPPNMAVQFWDRAKKWVESPYKLRMPEKLGDLLAHLAGGGEGSAALDLASVALAILPDPTAKPRTADDPYVFPPEPVARFDDWHYERMVSKFLRPLVDVTGVRAVELFCDLLESAVRLSRHPNEDDEPEDYSNNWRPAIEHNEEPRSIKDILVSAVRNVAEPLAGGNPEQLRPVIEMLEARRWRIFRRIALHLLRLFPDGAPELVAARLTDRALFDDYGSHREYALLARAGFSRLPDSGQQEILAWIEAGPNLDQYKDSREQFFGERPSDEQAEQYKKLWQRDHLVAIADSIPPAWRERYEALVSEVGAPESSDALPAEGTWVGPRSPKTLDELRAMGTEALLQYLTSWQAPQGPMQPTPNGLGHDLSNLVASEPDRFAQAAEMFKPLDPTYVRSLFSGLREAVKQRRPFVWDGVLGLADWVMQQPREIPGRKTGHFDVDPDWGWTRRAITDLLEVGFQEGPAEIPVALRELAWRVLHSLTDDPEPTPEDEAHYGGSNMDPATLSINTTRGVAIHAVVSYALWVRRRLQKEPDGESRIARGLAEMPEVRDVLDSHLKPDRDPSVAVRSVYGRYFPWLVLLDSTWAAAQVARVFPVAPEESHFRDAAWESYVVFCAPYDAVFGILQEEYRGAIDRLGSRESRRHPGDPGQRLAEHLMVLYWRGLLSFEETGGLLNQFYERASDKLRAHATEFVGRRLWKTEGDVPPEILERLKGLWAFRVQTARSATSLDSFVEELARFGWWFVSGKFEEDWAVQLLRTLLDVARKAEPDHLIAERLAGLSASRPLDAVQCLSGIIEADREGWGLLGWENHARTILATAVQSENAQAHRAARDLVDRLGARGYLAFRDLLRQGSVPQ